MLTVCIIYYDFVAKQYIGESETKLILNYNCSTLQHYTHGLCYKTLKQYLIARNCDINSDGSISILINGKKQLKKVMKQLSFFRISKKCKTSLIPFLCLNFLGTCGGHDTYFYTSGSSCNKVKKDCKKEWNAAEALTKSNHKDYFPNCQDFYGRENSNCKEGTNLTISNEPGNY